MERLLFKRIELWLVLFLAVLAVIGMILFGALVRSAAMGFQKYGKLGDTALALATVPSDGMRVLRGEIRLDATTMRVSDAPRFEGHAGWVFNREDAGALPDGYLLFSRYDGDAEHHIIELVDLQTGDVAHRIDLDADTLLDGAERDSALIDFTDWTTTRFRAIHPEVMPGGDLMIKDHRSPLLRINACGQAVWRLENDLYHHTTEIGPDGHYWLTAHVEPTQIEGLTKEFFDNSIVQVTADGEVLYDRSLTQVMIKAGLGYMLFGNGRFDRDPKHLNDVQPVLEDGPHWKAGDVFLSLRHQSMIMQFRPSTDEVIWFKRGPWSAQHDVDIIDDHTIGVFNNNMQNRGNGEFVDGTSEVLFYDFDTDEISSPFKALFDKHEIRTESEGLFTLTDTGHLLIEEADAGRTLIFGPDGALAAEHVNRAGDGSVYHVGWSRYLDRQTGDTALAGMTAQNCE